MGINELRKACLKTAASERHAFGDRRPDVVCGQVVHEVVLHHHGKPGEAAHHVTEQRQRGVMKQVDELIPCPHVVEIRVGEPEKGNHPPLAPR